MALELLTVVDHLSLALKHANEGGSSGDALQQGVEMVHRQFRDVLEKFGITPFKAEGECFDPAMHEAMMQVETSDVPENRVVQVFQDGYLYHEKILRHAKVGVSKKPPTSESAPAATRAENGKEDLIQDFVSIVTSFCARLYGQRRSRRKAERIIAELQREEGDHPSQTRPG